MISFGEFILLSLIVISAVLATVYLNRKLKEKGYKVNNLLNLLAVLAVSTVLCLVGTSVAWILKGVAFALILLYASVEDLTKREADDCLWVKRYSEEAKLLAANDIVTAEDLRHFTENIGTRFKSLAYERAKQRNRLRRMHDSAAMQPTKEIIYDLTAQMAELRRQMKLCEDIAERCGVVEMVVNEIERGQIAEKKKSAEKKKCEKGIDI